MKTLEFMDEVDLRDFMNLMGNGIEYMAQELGVEKPMFVLVLFNDPKVGQYVSNCERADVIKAMRETADRLERNQDVPSARNLMTNPDQSPWTDPNVTEALKQGRTPDDICLVQCPNCSEYSYYNQGSHWTCRHCDETLTAENIDDDEMITLADYSDLDAMEEEEELP